MHIRKFYYNYGKQELCIAVDNLDEVRDYIEHFNLQKDYDYEIHIEQRRVKKGRKMTNFIWKLLGDLATTQEHMPLNDMYQMKLQEYAPVASELHIPEGDDPHKYVDGKPITFIEKYNDDNGQVMELYLVRKSLGDMDNVEAWHFAECLVYDCMDAGIFVYMPPKSES